MGISIDASVYAVADIKATVQRLATRNTDNHPVNETLDSILPLFGAVVEKNFVIVYNEAWDDYNPAFEFENFLVRLYGVPDEERWGAHFPAKSLHEVTGGANADDVAYTLDIELPDEDDDE